MKNKLSDIHNMLVAQMERLSDDNLCPDTLNEELVRTRALCGITKAIVENGRLALSLATAMGDSPVNDMFRLPNPAPDSSDAVQEQG